jgi:hypothetical protein
MTVIAFESRPQRDGNWRACELDLLMRSFAGAVARGQAGGWDIGSTEIGDPQFYLLGPAPDEECILCISRVGRAYLLQDGEGRVLSEHAHVSRVVDAATALLRKGRPSLVARTLLLGCSLRHAFEERVEPMLVEGEELLTHFAPQLVALA